MKIIRSFKVGEPIYLLGQNGPAYRVISGSIRLDRMYQDGRLAFANIAIAGDLIGAEVLLNQSYGFEARVLTDCKIEEWKEPTFLWGEPLAKELIKVSQRQTDAVSLRCGAAMDRILKLIHLIREPSYVFESKLVLPRLKDAAEITDLTIETVSRCISMLRKQGVLTPIQGDSGNLRSQFKLSQPVSERMVA